LLVRDAGKMIIDNGDVGCGLSVGVASLASAGWLWWAAPFHLAVGCHGAGPTACVYVDVYMYVHVHWYSCSVTAGISMIPDLF
jgi:hypothetical protein